MDNINQSINPSITQSISHSMLFVQRLCRVIETAHCLPRMYIFLIEHKAIGGIGTFSHVTYLSGKFHEKHHTINYLLQVKRVHMEPQLGCYPERCLIAFALFIIQDFITGMNVALFNVLTRPPKHSLRPLQLDMLMVFRLVHNTGRSRHVAPLNLVTERLSQKMGYLFSGPQRRPQRPAASYSPFGWYLLAQ